MSLEQARRHPALWDAETKVKKVCDWSRSWERGAALQQKLDRHAAAVGGMLPKGEEGQSAEGWLAKLDEPVRRRLLAPGPYHRHYDGRKITHLLQAVCTIHRRLLCHTLTLETCHQLRLSEKGVRLAQKMRVGPCIPVGTRP